MRLTDKVALITGAGSGIGKAIATTFAAAQATVIIADKQLPNADAVATEIKKLGGKAQALGLDVTQESAVEQAVKNIMATYGAIHILVSNAGIQHIAPIHELSYEDWQAVLNVHLNGAFLTTRACFRAMMQTHSGGSIIYLGSVHSKEASRLKAPYVTAKHGLLGLCRTVAKEGAPFGIRANVICPGFVRTPLVEKQIPEQAQTLNISEEDVVKKIMLGATVDGEFTTLEDIATLALFFASFKTQVLTGQSLIASHGWCME